MNPVYILMLHILLAIPLFSIAKRLEHEMPWLAFVPLGNLWLMTDLADREWYWVIGLLVPYVNLIVLIPIWMSIAQTLDRPNWLGFLIVLPIINLLMVYYLAYWPSPYSTQSILE